MRTYRLIVFDLGHPNAVVEFEAADDAAALEEAKKHFPDQHRELWEQRRFVGRLSE